MAHRTRLAKFIILCVVSRLLTVSGSIAPFSKEVENSLLWIIFLKHAYKYLLGEPIYIYIFWQSTCLCLIKVFVSRLMFGFFFGKKNCFSKIIETAPIGASTCNKPQKRCTRSVPWQRHMTSVAAWCTCEPCLISYLRCAAQCSSNQIVHR